MDTSAPEADGQTLFAVEGTRPRVLNVPLQIAPTFLDGEDGYLIQLGSEEVWLDARAADRLGRRLLFDR